MEKKKMARLKVRCIDNRVYLAPTEHGWFQEGPQEDDTTDLTIGKVYEVLSVEGGDYRIIDDTSEDYLYPAYMFEAIKDLEEHGEESPVAARPASVRKD